MCEKFVFEFRELRPQYPENITADERYLFYLLNLGCSTFISKIS